MRIISVTLFFLFISVGLLNAHTIESIPNPKHENKHTYVSNPDGILSAGSVSELNSLLDELEQENGAEVAVVAVKTIGNNDIKVFATDLFEAWGIGKAEIDNGFLILFVEDQRKITFETGYGLEGILPDAICKRIQMDTMIPHFKEREYDAGILAGTKRVVSIISGVESVSSNQSYGIYDSGTADDFQNTVTTKNSRKSLEDRIRELLPANIILISIILIAAFFFIIKNIRKTNNNPELSNAAKCIVIREEKNKILLIVSVATFFFSIFFAVFFQQFAHLTSLFLTPFVLILPNKYAKWKMDKIQNTPMLCKLCQGEMHLLPDKKEKKYLQSPQIMEEDINSVMYDVYYCEACENSKVYKLDIKGKYIRCPKCENKTYAEVKSRILRAATYSSTGLRRVTFQCKYCKYKNSEEVVIPRKEDSSSSSSSSSSGSSSSGGSFGGGRSGGGGSTSSW